MSSVVGGGAYTNSGYGNSGYGGSNSGYSSGYNSKYDHHDNKKKN